MGPTGPIGRPLRRQTAGGPVDSRWWYWVAALPLTFALWVLTVAWVTVAVGLAPVVESHPVAAAAEISLVAFGVPFLVLTAVFPFAVYADASAVSDSGLDWRPRRAPLTVAASIGPVAAVATVIYGVATGGGVAVPLRAAVGGVLLAVPVAAYYLRRRQQNLGTP